MFAMSVVDNEAAMLIQEMTEAGAQEQRFMEDEITSSSLLGSQTSHVGIYCVDTRIL